MEKSVASVSIPKELIAKIKKIALAEKRTFSGQVEIFIEDGMALREKSLTREKSLARQKTASPA